MKKILLASIDAGSGHVAVRDSIYDQLETAGKYKLIKYHSQNQLVDRLYKASVNYLPVYDLFYDLSESDLVSYFLLETNIDIYLETLGVIKKQKPDLIICTHPVITSLFVKARKQAKQHMPIVSVYPDYGEMHKIYYPPRTHLKPDKIWVTSDYAYKSGIEKLKIPGDILDRIAILPPKEILGNVQKNLTKEEWRKDLLINLPESTIGSIKPDVFTVLLVAGGAWISKLEDVFNMIQDVYTDGWPEIQLLIVCGKDKDFHKKLYRMIADKKYAVPFAAFGFINRDDISRVFLSSDMVIMGSVGAGVLKEIAFTKVMPAISFNNLGGVEKGNLNFGIDQGIVKEIIDTNEIVSEIMETAEGKRERDIQKMVAKCDEFVADHYKYSDDVLKLVDDLLK